jgi:hypothetical protein
MGSNVVAVFMDEFLFMNKKAFPSIFPTTATGALLVMTSSMAPGGDSSALSLLDVKYDDGTNVIQKLNWIQVKFDFSFPNLSFKYKQTETIRHVRNVKPKEFQRNALMFLVLLNISNLMQVKLVLVNCLVVILLHMNERCCMFPYSPVSHTHKLTNHLSRNVTEDPTTTPAFEGKWIDQMVNNKYELNEDIKYLYITIDPSGGQNRNLYVLTSTVFTLDGTCVVCSSSFSNTYNLHTKYHYNNRTSRQWRSYQTRNRL